jgi:hypothetical protein
MRTTVIALGSLLLATACATENTISRTPESYGADFASITSRVCHPLTGNWIEGALVYTNVLNSDDQIVDTRVTWTDSEGLYVLEDLPAPNDYEVWVQAGQDLLDLFEVRVEVAEDKLVVRDNCAVGGDLNVAVITGDYDESIDMFAALGISNVTLINGLTGSEITDFLTDASYLADFNMVFLDGGHIEAGVIYAQGLEDQETVAAVQEALRAYVEDEGGMLIASDWAYDAIERVWPEQIDWMGDDTVPDDAQVGEAMTVQGEIVNEELANAVGFGSINISYDLSVWPVMVSVADGVTVHLTGGIKYREGMDAYSVLDAPLAASFSPGNGRVLVTTWRNQANNKEKMVELLTELLGL